MRKITIIASAHKKKGECNSNELLKIIEKISPDVIYEELSPKLFLDIYKNSKVDTLESIAIKRYIFKNNVQQIPIDIAEDELINIDFKKKISELYNLFEQNIEYKLLSDHHRYLVFRFGFKYLNSIKCVEYFEKSLVMENVMLKISNNPKLVKTYELWHDLNERRENHMVNKINNHIIPKKSINAIFIIGAAHIKSIVNKFTIVNKKNSENYSLIYNSI